MKNKTIVALALLPFITFVACSLNNKIDESKPVSVLELTSQKQEPHRYGGWYCPDNLYGFPAVNIADWKNVPVVNGRMPNEKDRENGSTLILVDAEKYPNAKPLDMEMPRLAKFYCHSSKREEIIIVIQALSIQNDSIAGFRYLNGGNGSARLEKVKFLSDADIEKIPNNKFVSYEIDINNTQEAISEVMRSPKHTEAFHNVIDENGNLCKSWRKTTNLNYIYSNAGIVNAAYADILFGNFYVQNDFDNLSYTEKFLLTTDQETNITTLKITCGPFAENYEQQKVSLTNWAKKVKELSEKE